jgi:hypothetical protein
MRRTILDMVARGFCGPSLESALSVPKVHVSLFQAINLLQEGELFREMKKEQSPKIQF